MLEKELISSLEDNGIYVNKSDFNAELEMDSIQYVSLIVELEERFHITVPDEYLGHEIPNTVNSFIKMIKKLMK